MSEPVRVVRTPRTFRAGALRGVPTVLVTAIGATALAGSAQASPAQPGQDQSRPLQARTTSLVPVTASVAATVAAPVRTVATAATYTVRAGDTVSHIALRLGSSSSAIVAANGLDSRAFIREGQVLTIPTAAVAAAAPAPAAERYTVRRGDTVGAIAARFGTTTATVVAANGLDARAFIREGQVLSVPDGSGAAAPAAPQAAPAPAASYTVRAGDTLGHVAGRAGTTVAALRAANPSLDDRGTIRIGQVIAVPGGTATPAAAPLPNTFAGRTYPAATVQAATANRDALAGRQVPSRDQMRQIIADTARARGVDPAMAQAVAVQESGFNMRAVSPANAVGAMQVIPSSGEWASEMAGRRLDLLDPKDNALAGVLILRAHARSGADEATVLAAYYQGMSSVRRNGMFPDTRRYVVNVQTLMARYR